MKIEAIVERVSRDVEMECVDISGLRSVGQSEPEFRASLVYWYPEGASKWKPGDVVKIEITGTAG